MNLVKFIKVSTSILNSDSFTFFKKDKKNRDTFEAVWLELLVLAGRINNNGFFFNDEVDYDVKEISILIDRSVKQLNNCINVYTMYKMVERVNGKLCISNWMKYQKQEGLDKIRDQWAEAKRKQRAKKKELTSEEEMSIGQSKDSPETVLNSSHASVSQEEIRNKNEYMNKRINEFIISENSRNPFVLYIFNNGYCDGRDSLDIPFYETLFNSLKSNFDYEDLKNVVARFCKYADSSLVTNKFKYLESSIKNGLFILENSRNAGVEYENALLEYEQSLKGGQYEAN